jgi:hypothetical protein
MTVLCMYTCSLFVGSGALASRVGPARRHDGAAEVQVVPTEEYGPGRPHVARQTPRVRRLGESGAVAAAAWCLIDGSTGSWHAGYQTPFARTATAPTNPSSAFRDLRMEAE